MSEATADAGEASPPSFTLEEDLIIPPPRVEKNFPRLTAALESGVEKPRADSNTCSAREVRGEGNFNDRAVRRTLAACAT